MSQIGKGQTASQATQKRYKKIAYSLVKEYQTLTGQTFLQSPAAFFRYLLNRRYLYSASTWRTYRAALVYELGLSSWRPLAEKFKTVPPLTKSYKAHKQGDLVGSQQKLKKFDSKRRQKVDKYFQKKKTKYGDSVLLWINATVLTGLRPDEWKHAKLVKTLEGLWLIVENAKNTNDRGNGAFRSIGLRLLREDEINVIVKHLIQVEEKRKSEEAWNEFYEGCRNTLYRATRSLWPKTKKWPCLYSARHQFSSNMKSLGLREEEIAGLMGHASSATAVKHYGRGRDADPNPSRVLSKPEEVARVRLKHRQRPSKSMKLSN